MEKELHFFFEDRDFIQKDKDKLIFFNKTN
jgi:hypothetical protein